MVDCLDVPREEYERLLGRSSAVDKLCVQIYEAFSGNLNEETPEKERHKYILALMAVIDFFKDEAEDSFSAEAMAKIYSVFRGIERGEDAPVAKPLRREDVKGGQRPTREEILREQGHACIAYEALINAGKGRQEAAEHLARHFPGLARLMSGKAKTLPGAIKYWAGEMASRSPRSGYAVKAYKQGLRRALPQVEGLPIGSREQAAERLVARWLAQYAKS